METIAAWTEPVDALVRNMLFFCRLQRLGGHSGLRILGLSFWRC